jgi:hypothetical protein
MIEGNGDLALLHETFVDNVEHLEERHVRADVACLVLDHAPG